jgi:hypothetical protein
MRKSILFVLGIMVCATIFMSFKYKNKISQRYGGSATVAVEAKRQIPDSPCAYTMFLDQVIVEDQRIIDVDVDCIYETESKAKSALAQEISNDIKCYERKMSSIIYDIDSCEN